MSLAFIYFKAKTKLLCSFTLLLNSLILIPIFSLSLPRSSFFRFFPSFHLLSSLLFFLVFLCFSFLLSMYILLSHFTIFSLFSAIFHSFSDLFPSSYLLSYFCSHFPSCFSFLLSLFIIFSLHAAVACIVLHLLAFSLQKQQMQ